MLTDGNGRSPLGSFSLEGSALIEPWAYQRGGYCAKMKPRGHEVAFPGGVRLKGGRGRSPVGDAKRRFYGVDTSLGRG